MSDLTFTVEASPSGQCVLDVTGDLDLHTAHRLQHTLDGLAFAGGLVIDLSGVTYCDSTGLTALVGAYRRTQAEHTGFALCGTSQELTRIFQIVGIDQIVAMYDTADQASQALRDAAGRAR
ncbi:anti-sigma B factor antagonist [Streptomyces sp. DvalAA-14]|uniref:STAS domain-containing protein n=1 Tax=unclassified Streptomyces TaxID=2593676 RepID=UPI00081B8BED|nr:STAS domain-containing protein [Streptomyces sp. DvalAA-14]MYS23534.1 anti-sigma factor antagonist [Streptomyces sp. SID4948]SCE34866.1 anti-sigma B factor antagonist [Streptomyces sp. DvalAA-14]